ncbi:MAG: FtsX-like permease family protein [bacterium]
MRILSLLQINAFKLRQHKVKAMFLILPVSILMVLTIVVSSQVANFKSAADESIFGTINNQATLINLSKTVDFTANRGPQQQSFNSENQFTGSDIDKITAISNVTSASINSQVPVTNVKTTDLFADKTYNISNINEIDKYSASLYTQEDFTYTEGQAIPIILNANTFMEQTENWNGQTSIAVTFNRGTRPNTRSTGTSAPNQDPLSGTNSPIKTQAIAYDKSTLIGKTFTVTVGGLSAIQDYTITQASGTLTFTKLTADEINTKLATEKTDISKYWDYDKLNTPQTYTFKVVGLIESQGDNKTYIPADFADVVVNKYVQNQLSARNTTDIPTTDLNSTYRGITYDGTQLTSTSNGFGGFGGRGGRGGFGGGANMPRPGENQTSTASYNIPGLVISLSADGQETVEGVSTDADVYKNSVKTGTSISLKINSVYDRSQVVKDLNTAGYAYQDINNLDVFNNLKNTLSSISTGLTISFTILSIAVIIFAMSKFVSDSRKEIGIFRAIGMKKIHIIIMFTTQALLYTAIGFIIGGGLGIILNQASASFMNSWFDSLIMKTIKQTYNVVNAVDTSIFTRLSWQTIEYYSIALLVITLVISLIPALRASSISPVEAIKGE